MLAFLSSRTGVAVIGIVAVLSATLTFSHRFAYQAGRTAERTAILNRSVEILRERNATDDEIKGMDDRQLCLALGGLPDECAGLGL